MITFTPSLENRLSPAHCDKPVAIGGRQLADGQRRCTSHRPRTISSMSWMYDRLPVASTSVPACSWWPGHRGGLVFQDDERDVLPGLDGCC